MKITPRAFPFLRTASTCCAIALLSSPQLPIVSAQTASVQVSPPRARAIELVSRAAERFAARRYAETVALCRQAIATDAKYVRSYTWLGAAQQKLGRVELARAAYERVLTLAPKSADATRARRGLSELKPRKAGGAPRVSTPANRVTSANNERIVFRLQGHKSGVRALAWSPNGRILASGSDDKTVCLWDAQTGQKVGVWKGHSDVVSALAWSRDGKTLASGSFDNTVRLWPVQPSKWAQPGRARVLEGDGFDFGALAWSRDGSVLAGGAGNGSLWLWNVKSGEALKIIEGHNGAVLSLTFGELNKRPVLLSSGFGGNTSLWEIPSVKQLNSVTRSSSTVATLSADNRILAIGSGDQISLLLTKDMSYRRAFTVPQNSVSTLQSAPTGSLLAAGYYEGATRLWDLNGSGAPRVLYGQNRGVRALAWSPNGQLLAVGSDERIIKVWRISG